MIYIADSLPTISSGIEKLRQVIIDSQGKDSVYGRAVNGSFPLVVDVDNEVGPPSPFFIVTANSISTISNNSSSSNKIFRS